MNIIITCGYMGSGSSAITDILGEYDCFFNKTGSFEYVFLHCPNGLFELEDRLLKGNNVIISDYAIKVFRMQMNDLYYKRFWWVGNYKKIFGKGFLTNTERFLLEITDFNYEGKWYMQEIPSKYENIRRYLTHAIQRLSKGKIHFNDRLKYKNMEISYITPSNFYSYAYKYIEENIALLYDGGKPIILDQFLLPHNLYRMEKYFDNNANAIVVERDPRDVFIANKYFWSKNNDDVPYPMDVVEFCDYYKKMRENETVVKKNVLRLKFENLVLNYEESIEEIESFLNINKNEHSNPKSLFNPKVSIGNLMVFENSPIYSAECEVIKCKLSNYLFDFGPYEEKIKNSKKGIEVF